METPKVNDIHLERAGTGNVPVFWGHGWGRSHADFLPLARALGHMGAHRILDFPGFGTSPLPPEHWGTAEYADAVAALIKRETDQKIIWVGHSFGCRIGIQLATRHPGLVGGLFLIAAAGLPRKRPLLQKLYLKARITLYKFLKKLIPMGLPEQWLMRTFASPDYLNAGSLRKIFVRVVNEDLSAAARTITCPVMLVYGANDTETPPEIGTRLQGLIPKARLIVLNGFDHSTILTQARHQVVQILNSFIEETKP